MLTVYSCVTAKLDQSAVSMQWMKFLLITIL